MVKGRPSIYPFKEISTLSASVQPFSEVLHLWDVMIAFGVHLNILFILAQLVKRRTKILSSTRYGIIVALLLVSFSFRTDLSL
jgi:hypothetical protein